MLQLYNFEHDIGWHFYDIPTLVVLIIAIAVFGVHLYLQHKREKDFEEELEHDKFGAEIQEEQNVIYN